MQQTHYGKMQTCIYDSNEDMGRAAAADLAEILRSAVARDGKAAVILATGNSQLSFMAAMRVEPNVPWDRITVFHMDQYLGMADDHPASFPRYIREKLTDIVHPAAFYGMGGALKDVQGEIDRYTALLREHQPVACVLGIGENGHLAFNDPPASFDTPADVHVVKLAETARRQQVGEGHFATLDDVPTHALTLTIPMLLRPEHVLAVVPEARKAEAVKAALEGPLTPDCPASILKTLDHVKLYLDPDSASLL